MDFASFQRLVDLLIQWHGYNKFGYTDFFIQDCKKLFDMKYQEEDWELYINNIISESICVCKDINTTICTSYTLFVGIFRNEILYTEFSSYIARDWFYFDIGLIQRIVRDYYEGANITEEFRLTITYHMVQLFSAYHADEFAFRHRYQVADVVPGEAITSAAYKILQGTPFNGKFQFFKNK